MENRIIPEKKVYSAYLGYRQQVLDYSYRDMNLTLNNYKQVYIAVFDIPLPSGILGHQTQTLALVFGLNTHLYHGSGEVMVELEKDPRVMRAMQTLLISSGQALAKMQLVSETEFYNSDNVRAYLKTRKGTYFKELTGNSKEDRFLSMLLDSIMKEINRSI